MQRDVRAVFEFRFNREWIIAWRYLNVDTCDRKPYPAISTGKERDRMSLPLARDSGRIIMQRDSQDARRAIRQIRPA